VCGSARATIPPLPDSAAGSGTPVAPSALGALLERMYGTTQKT
jgi:hypothetical protein